MKLAKDITDKIEAAVKNNDLGALDALLNTNTSDKKEAGVEQRFGNLASLLTAESELCIAVLSKVLCNSDLSDKCFYMFRDGHYDSDAIINSLDRLRWLAHQTFLHATRVSIGTAQLCVFLKNPRNILPGFMYDIFQDVLIDNKAFINYFKGNLETLPLIRQLFFYPPDQDTPYYPVVLSDGIFQRIVYHPEIFWSLIETVDDLEKLCSAMSETKEYVIIAISEALTHLDKFGELSWQDKRLMMDLTMKYPIVSRDMIVTHLDSFIADAQAETEKKLQQASIQVGSMFAKKEVHGTTPVMTDTKETMSAKLSS